MPKNTVKLAKVEREIILRMIYIAQANSMSEGDYQGWTKRHWKLLDSLIEKMLQIGKGGD